MILLSRGDTVSRGISTSAQLLLECPLWSSTIGSFGSIA